MNTPYYCWTCSRALGVLYAYPPAPDVYCGNCMSPLGDEERDIAIRRAKLETLQKIADRLGTHVPISPEESSGGPVPALVSAHSRAATPGDLMDAREAARYLRLPSERALYQSVRRGTVPALRVGKRILRFRKSELDALLRATETR